jgi:hypothetical protein
LLLRRRLSFSFFLKREDVPSPWSTTCFPLPGGVLRVATTASLPPAWLLVMSRSSQVVRGMRHPSRWMREVQVVPFWNAEMVSLSVAPGSSV